MVDWLPGGSVEWLSGWLAAWGGWLLLDVQGAGAGCSATQYRSLCGWQANKTRRGGDDGDRIAASFDFEGSYMKHKDGAGGGGT